MNHVAAAALGWLMIAGYLFIAYGCTRSVWGLVSGLNSRTAQIAVTALIPAFFLAPGVIGAGHGVAFAPAWMMYTSDTFATLTRHSQGIALLVIPATWVLITAIWLGVELCRGGRRSEN